MGTRRVRLRIAGTVQGVFFRESARREAQRLSLEGYVKNLDDGNVLAVAQGPDHAVAEFAAWCKQGPPSARVTRVEVTEESVSGELSAFWVER